jgi:hypothetical protein
MSPYSRSSTTRAVTATRWSSGRSSTSADNLDVAGQPLDPQQVRVDRLDFAPCRAARLSSLRCTAKPLGVAPFRGGHREFDGRLNDCCSGARHRHTGGRATGSSRRPASSPASRCGRSSWRSSRTIRRSLLRRRPASPRRGAKMTRPAVPGRGAGCCPPCSPATGWRSWRAARPRWGPQSWPPCLSSAVARRATDPRRLASWRPTW